MHAEGCGLQLDWKVCWQTNHAPGDPPRQSKCLSMLGANYPGVNKVVSDWLNLTEEIAHPCESRLALNDISIVGLRGNSTSG